MTIRDLTKNIELQGDFSVRVYDEAKEKYIFEKPLTDQASKKYFDFEVKYIYSKDNIVVLEVVK